MPRAKNEKSKRSTRKRPERPLTLTALVRYNNKIFLPALEHRFATKDELNNGLDEVKDELNEVKEKLAKLDDVPDSLDKILKITEDIQQENTMQVAANQRFSKHLENHETRITKLELTAKSAL